MTNPGITRIHCPLLAFFGTNGDVGGEKDLELLKVSTKRQQSGPSSVNTALIKGANHMYAGQEDQVAQVIARWEDGSSREEQSVKTQTGNRLNWRNIPISLIYGAGTRFAGAITTEDAPALAVLEGRAAIGP